MALEEFKELDELKSEHEKLINEYWDRRGKDNDKFYYNAITEFETFLTSKDFKIIKTTKVIKAIYEETEVKLNIPIKEASGNRKLEIIVSKKSVKPEVIWDLTI